MVKGKILYKEKSGIKEEEFSNYIIKFLWEYKIEKLLRCSKLIFLLHSYY